MHQLGLMGRGQSKFAGLRNLRRDDLDGASWLERGRRVLEGHERLFGRCVVEVPWESEQRVMYDRVVQVPRLLANVPSAEVSFPEITALTRALEDRYRTHFETTNFVYYRDGRDSVAFHQDQELQDAENTVVAIASLGEPRRLLIRPAAQNAGATRRQSRAYSLGWGDLLVMGGRCQSDWEHGVPKTTQAGPRLSVVLRGVRGAPNMCSALTSDEREAS